MVFLRSALYVVDSIIIIIIIIIYLGCEYIEAYTILTYIVVCMMRAVEVYRGSFSPSYLTQLAKLNDYLQDLSIIVTRASWEWTLIIQSL